MQYLLDMVGVFYISKFCQNRHKPKPQNNAQKTTKNHLEQ